MRLLALLLLAGSLFAQTPISSNLPTLLFGGGVSWRRGAAYPLSQDDVFAKNFSAVDSTGKKVPTNWYLWTMASTPITPTPAGGTPVPSTLSAGATYVAAQNTAGTVFLALNVLGGLSATQATAGAQFTGNVGVAIKLGQTHMYLFPYLGGSTATGGSTAGSFVAQPGVMLLYGFGGR